MCDSPNYQTADLWQQRDNEKVTNACVEIKKMELDRSTPTARIAPNLP